MPFLSVIIPVYGVQGYLRECLDSVLNQSLGDVEVIAVDDSSPDHCPRILDEYAQRDPRVRVIHLPHNVGNGHARNAGLDQATGEYVWFVDSDDSLAPGALQAVAKAVRRSSPQVLLIDHARVDPLGEHHPRDGAPLPGPADASATTVLENPLLLNVFTVAWNKIIRRDFLLGTGIRFDVGWYEDIPFTYPVLVAAQRIATLNRICYHYRRRRRDAITQTRSDRHFEVFDQWSRVFERLDRMAQGFGPDPAYSPGFSPRLGSGSGSRSADDGGGAGDGRGDGGGGRGRGGTDDGAAWRAMVLRDEIFKRMVWHLRVVLAMPDRLPAHARRAFFHRMSRHYHWYRPPGDGAPADTLERLRHRLIEADSYRAFQHLRAVRVVAMTGRRCAATGARLVRRAGVGLLRRGQIIAGIAIYHLLRLLPVDRRLAVYAAYWYRGYACNPAAVYEKARELVPHVRGVWVVDRNHADSMPADVSYVVDGSLRYYRALARARWLVNNVNFPDFVVKRPGTTYLQTHHGTPVKVMGVGQRAYPLVGQRMDMSGLLKRSDRWDFSVTANAHSSEVWSRAYPCRYETLEHGYPRNDRLARAAQPDGAQDVTATRQRLGLPDDATVVLYAPTLREYAPGFQSPLDVEDFARAVGPDVVVLQRAHYLYGHDGTDTDDAHAGDQGTGADEAGPTEGTVRDVSGYPVVEDLMVAADVLITDYSSVMFDYAVLDRPEVIYAPDWDSYVRMRGVTFDLLAEPPGVVATNHADLVDAFRSGTVWDDDATEARGRFRARFAYLDDGNASERVVRTVFSSELGPQPDPDPDPASPDRESSELEPAGLESAGSQSGGSESGAESEGAGGAAGLESALDSRLDLTAPSEVDPELARRE